jgi:hypothetical protein
MKTDKAREVLQKAKDFGMRFTDFTCTYDALVKAYMVGHSDADAAIEQLEQELSAHKEQNLARMNIVLQLEQKVKEAEVKLKIATEALRTIHIGVDPRNGEWSEQFQDTMLKAFTAKTASDYANETLKQLEEK